MAAVKGTYWNTAVPNPAGMMHSSLAIYSETFTPGALNDTRKLLQLPRGVTIGAGTFFQVSDMDTGGPTLVLTLRVTDGTTTKDIINGSAAGGTGGLARPSKIPATEPGVGFTTTNHNFWLELLVATAATTAASGTFVYGIELSGHYLSGAVSE
jgi:hypothetical protein